LNESADNSLHHPTLNDLLDESLNTTIGSLNPAVQSGDFNKAVKLMQQRALSYDEKYYLLTSYFNPDRAYTDFHLLSMVSIRVSNNIAGLLTTMAGLF